MFFHKYGYHKTRSEGVRTDGGGCPGSTKTAGDDSRRECADRVAEVAGLVPSPVALVIIRAVASFRSVSSMVEAIFNRNESLVARL